MKLTGYIFSSILLLFAMSCAKEGAASQNESKIILDWPGYIWFGAETGTKTAALESMNSRHFNVIAFKYNSDWATFKAVGTPASAMGTSGFLFPTDVTCDATGDCTYKSSDNTNPVEWDGTMKYSFFAYYPTAAADPASTVSLLSTSSTAGVPLIQYTVPAPEDGYMNASKVQDIMTAFSTDAQNTGAGVVNLNFKHRLCMFCVEARNLKAAPATISGLVLSIESKRYGEVIIPLDGSALQPSNIISGNFTCRMQPASGDGSSVVVEQFGNDGTSSNTLVSYPDNHIAFIPQNPEVIGENLSGRLLFEWNGVEKEQVFTATKPFDEGRKYSFVITIAADDAISIDIRESEDWAECGNTLIFE